MKLPHRRHFLHLEWLPQGWPVAIGGQLVVSVARDEDEPYVTGDEGIGNRPDGPAFEISIEDRQIEVGFPRPFQRLVDARGLGADALAELTYHSPDHHPHHPVVSDHQT